MRHGNSFCQTMEEGNGTANEWTIKYFLLLCAESLTHIMLVLNQDKLSDFYGVPHARS